MSHLDLGLAPRISQTGVVDGVNASKSILAKKVRPFHSHMDGRLDGWMDHYMMDKESMRQSTTTIPPLGLATLCMNCCFVVLRLSHGRTDGRMICLKAFHSINGVFILPRIQKV